MKLFIVIFSLLYILTPNSSATPNPPPSDVVIQFGFFYSSLSHHGEWIEGESGIRVWRPFHVPHQWRPYLIGRWVWTDEYGWYWMSNEPFGWMTYHYGRWYYDDYYGWVWMPDDVWAPAWVEWRYNDDYIGWAPLPPYARFNMTFGIRFTTHWSAPVHYWNFVHYNRFGSVIRFRDTAPERQARRLIRTGRSGSQFEIKHDRIINRGIDRTIIERRGNIQFTRTEIKEVREQSGERMTRSNNNQRIEVYRPTRDEMQRSAERVVTHRGERNLSIDIIKIDRSRDESRTPSDERLPRHETRSDDPRHESELQTGRSRERMPQGQEQPSQREAKEKRRELIQRHERTRNPSPPAARETQQGRVERRSENARIAQPSRPAQERRSEHKSERRRNKY